MLGVAVLNMTHCVVASVVLVHLPQPTVQSVLAVPGNMPIDLGLAGVGRFEALWEVPAVAPVVPGVDLVVVSPPGRVDHWVKRGGAGALSFAFVRVLNLEAVLRTVARCPTRWIF